MTQRRGFTLLEVSVAGALLAVATLLAVQTRGVHAAAGRAQSAEQIALAEAENLLERLTVWPWDELDSENLQGLTLDDAAAAALSGATLEVTVDPPRGAPPAKRIAVQITYAGAGGPAARSVRLVAWRYRTPEEWPQ